MIRVLELLESEADFQTRRCVEHLSRQLGEGFAVEVRTIGRGGDWRSAVHAVPGLMRSQPFDVVHAWGLPALAAAVMGASGKLVYSPPVAVSRRSIGWLRAATGYRDIEVICPAAPMHRELVTAGVPAGRCHVIRPGVDFSRIRRRKDPELRAALGLAKDDFVLLAAGESTREASHRDAMWTGGILHVLDQHYKVLLWGRGADLGAPMSFARRQGLPGLACIAEQKLGRAVEVEELLPAADMILVPARGQVASLPIAAAMAAGLPIVASATPTTTELLEDRYTALLVAPGSPRVLAQRVLRLRDDGGLQWQISDMARVEAYEYFSLQRFLQQYRGVYRQVAGGEAVSVAEPAAGAGRRFHGRG